jgi:hypothetical protein
MRIWYKIIRKLYDRYEERLQKNIPQMSISMFNKYGIDLYEVRFNHKVLSTDQVDKVLLYEHLDTMQRMTTKNILYQYKCMEEGYVHSLDANITGVQYQPEKTNPKLWKHGPVIKEEDRKSWAYPYVSDQDLSPPTREIFPSGEVGYAAFKDAELKLAKFKDDKVVQSDSHTILVGGKKVQLDN